MTEYIIKKYFESQASFSFGRLHKGAGPPKWNTFTRLGFQRIGLQWGTLATVGRIGNTPKIVKKYYLGTLGDSLEKYSKNTPGDTQDSQKILKKYSREYFLSSLVELSKMCCALAPCI